VLTRSDACRRPSWWALKGAHAYAGQTDYVAGILSEEISELRVRGRRVQARLTVRRVCRWEARGDAAVARLVPLLPCRPGSSRGHLLYGEGITGR
jgi:hypothetical protein